MGFSEKNKSIKETQHFSEKILIHKISKKIW